MINEFQQACLKYCGLQLTAACHVERGSLSSVIKYVLMNVRTVVIIKRLSPVSLNFHV